MSREKSILLTSMVALALATGPSVTVAGPITSDRMMGPEPVGPIAGGPALPATGERAVPGIMGLPGSGVQGLQPGKLTDLAPVERTPAGRSEVASPPTFTAPSKQPGGSLTPAEAAQSPQPAGVLVIPGLEDMIISPEMHEMTNRTLPSGR